LKKGKEKMNQRTKMLQALFMSMQIRPESQPMDAAIILQSLCDATEAETPIEAIASILQMSKDSERLETVLTEKNKEISAIDWALRKMRDL
jgi:hypothetical protein